MRNTGTEDRSEECCQELRDIVDHTRDEKSVVRSRLLDLVQGRPGIRVGIKTAMLDPLRGYANAIRDELIDTVRVLDAFYMVGLASAMVNEVPRGVQ